jgi:hypothetical protein
MEPYDWSFQQPPQINHLAFLNNAPSGVNLPSHTLGVQSARNSRENSWENGRKTVGKSVGKQSGDQSENSREINRKTVGKQSENSRDSLFAKALNTSSLRTQE